MSLRFLFAVLPLVLTGCCYFAPCHPATYISGIVSDKNSGQVIANAEVRLYGYKAKAHSAGCFSLGGPDALPFEFAVSAPGYKPVIVRPAPGSYAVKVFLVREEGPAASIVEMKEVSREEFQKTSSGCL